MLMRAIDRDDEPEAVANVAFRIVSAGGERGSEENFGLTLDAPGERDEVIQHLGTSVLILDLQTSELLEDLTLDLVPTRDGKRLGIRSEKRS
jgi:Fe-S cluster assembly iron-binding protein IscA